MEKFEFEVAENEDAIRLDKFLTEKFAAIKPEINRTKIQHLIEMNMILDEKEKAVKSPAQKTKIGQKFFITTLDPKPSHLTAREIPFEIIFEDDDLLVINKPAGLTVHPGAGNQDDTLVNALLFTHQNKLSLVSGEFRPGIVHRLDKDTSGLMLVAKNDFTHQILSQKLKDREIKRTYLAFIYGQIKPAKGVINKNIVRSRMNRLKMSVSRTLGRDAITNYETKEVLHDGFASLLECRLQSGRTHQIRVHLESIKHSLIGDYLYNSAKKMLPKTFSEEAKNFIENFPRQALHSYKISFTHPRSEQEISFEIDLPEDLKQLKNFLKNG
ncbi:MAG: RluA family pseudouridine synthase [Proteobacteria bacterium]|nr:RluA family pseudouridine synthase [Pseudomonadota bacterium]